MWKINSDNCREPVYFARRSNAMCKAEHYEAREIYSAAIYDFLPLFYTLERVDCK